MQYREFSAKDVIQSVTYHPERFLEPVLDQLRVWKDDTTIVVKPWREFAVEVVDGEVCIDRVPLHPYVLWRLSSYLLGVSKNRWDFWMDNADMLAEGLNRGGPFQPEEKVEVRIVDGQVVYATHLGVDLGHHADYFEVMMTKLRKSSDAHKIPLSLLGYCVDPVWTHVNFVYLPRTMRSHHVGLRLDTNYLFSKSLRGRAYLSMLSYDLYWESSLNLDTWWSIRTKGLSRTADDLLPSFGRRVERYNKGIRAVARGTMQRLTRLSEKKARLPWRQALLTDMMSSFRREPIRSMAIRYEESGKDSALDFAFAMSKTVTDYPYDKRMMGERKLANRLKEVK
jgi:hypothetical protein